MAESFAELSHQESRGFKVSNLQWKMCGIIRKTGDCVSVFVNQQLKMHFFFKFIKNNINFSSSPLEKFFFLSLLNCLLYVNSFIISRYSGLSCFFIDFHCDSLWLGWVEFE
jgi:hypothetical protein